MEVKTQLFSQLREITGQSEIALQLPEDATVTDLLAQLYRDFPALEKWDRHLLVGAGVEFVGRDHRVSPNESIAIMPPVQGG